MVDDQFVWSSNLYKLRRQLSDKVQEFLDSYADGSVDRETLLVDCQARALELSLESGASLKTVGEVFRLKGIPLDVQKLRRAVAVRCE